MGQTRLWTAEEDAVLREHSDRPMSWEGWKDLLPGRSKFSINARRSKLGITMRGRAAGKARTAAPTATRGGWDEAQRAELRKGVAALVAATDHSLAQCAMEFNRLQEAERRERRGHPWE